MSGPMLYCADDRRREAVRAARDLNGLDYLDVVPVDPNDPSRGVTLHLFFLDKAPRELDVGNIRLEGGRRLRAEDIRVVAVNVYRFSDPERDDRAEVRLDLGNRSNWGDFATYTLRLVEADVEGRPTDETLDGIDRRYAHLPFSLTAGCPSDLDCAVTPPCPLPQYPDLAIDYLAKDYASFRRLIFDRLALTMPDWQERHVPDLGVTLVELLAYTGDQLSYYQDAVATEAYLDTARRRISVRRHTRLVDYPMHEGCNARAWVTVDVSDDLLAIDAADVMFIAGAPDLADDTRLLATLDQSSLPATVQDDQPRSLPGSYEIFEPVIERDPDTFEPIDLLEPDALVRVLKDGQTPAARHLRDLLEPDTTTLLAELAETTVQSEAILDALQAAVLDDLNRLLFARDLYDLQRIGGLRIEVRVQARLQLRGRELRSANRKLIEQVLPGMLREGGKLYFYRAHSHIDFYTWGDAECCLPRGATSATLCDAWEEVTEGDARAPRYRLDRALRHLREGDVLIFEERIGPKTANPADADPSHRHAVRLTKVVRGEDSLFKRPQTIRHHNPKTGRDDTEVRELPTPIVEIEWAAADALPFPLCLSTIGPAPECAQLTRVSVALGNAVLVDHGRTIRDEDLGYVPVAETDIACSGEGQLAETTMLPGPFRPHLRYGPLTFSLPLPRGADAAADIIPTIAQADPRKALPQVVLHCPADPPGRGIRVQQHQYPTKPRPPDDQQAGALVAIVPASAEVPAQPDPHYVQEWRPRPDLLGSRFGEPHFVVEIDDEGRAHLRFGNGELGLEPEAGARFRATYRVGNGPSGNVGADRITRLVVRNRSLSGFDIHPRNPLPARGGHLPEPLAEVKLLAPDYFRSDMRRAVTAGDYATLVMREFPNQVQRAAATLRWTGSRYAVAVAIDARGSTERDHALLDRIRAALRQYRRMGHDLLVETAHHVAVEIALTVCVKPRYLRGHVKAALLDLFSNRALAGGKLGYFHPDRLSFGDGIYLSRLVAEAMSVEGVDNVQVTRLQRRFEGPNGEIENGVLPLGPFEVARLDNDPSFPEHGQLTLNMEGGR